MRKRKGQAIVEFALVLPILLLLFCAIADFGRIFYASAHLNMVTQEAVRLAGLGRSDSEINVFVKNNVHLIDKDSIKINISPSGVGRVSGDYTKVEIIYEVKYVTPLMSIILPSPFQVITESTIRVE
jgi:Flp pilus assembly protein TadG